MNILKFSAVYFDGGPKVERLALHNGMEVEMSCRPSYYPAQGKIQVYVSDIRPGGLGRMQRELEQLKQKLQDEGLFDRERKKEIPFIPKCVGLITSQTGAAFRDFLKVVNRRYPSLHIKLIDARMQGDDSAVSGHKSDSLFK